MELSSFSSIYKTFMLELDTEHANHLCAKASTAALNNPTATYTFFLRYSYFKSLATPLVTRLSSTIALSDSVFSDPIVSSDICDREIIIAKHVLNSAKKQIFETKHTGMPKRMEAQVTLETVANFAGLDNRQRKQLQANPVLLQSCINQYKQRYSAKTNDQASIIKALGYHLMSEIRKPDEFKVIHEIIFYDYSTYPLRSWFAMHSIRTYENHQIATWSWISEQMSEEKGINSNDFSDAYQAIKNARRYVRLPLKEFDRLIIEGGKEFLEDMNNFFSILTSECNNSEDLTCYFA